MRSKGEGSPKGGEGTWTHVEAKVKELRHRLTGWFLVSFELSAGGKIMLKLVNKDKDMGENKDGGKSKRTSKVFETRTARTVGRACGEEHANGSK